MNGKLYKQARHYMQARLFTDFAMMHLKFFPYVILLNRVYLRRPPGHIYGQVSKPPKLPYVKPNAPVHVKKLLLWRVRGCHHGKSTRRASLYRVSPTTDKFAWGTESSAVYRVRAFGAIYPWPEIHLEEGKIRTQRGMGSARLYLPMIRHMKWQQFHNLDRSSPGSTRTAPSAAHHDGVEKYATGVTTSKVLARNNIIIGTWNLRTLRIACKLEE